MRKRSKVSVLTFGLLCLLPVVQNNLFQVGSTSIFGLVSLFLLIRFSTIKS